MWTRSNRLGTAPNFLSSLSCHPPETTRLQGIASSELCKNQIRLGLIYSETISTGASKQKCLLIHSLFTHLRVDMHSHLFFQGFMIVMVWISSTCCPQLSPTSPTHTHTLANKRVMFNPTNFFNINNVYIVFDNFVSNDDLSKRAIKYWTYKYKVHAMCKRNFKTFAYSINIV